MFIFTAKLNRRIIAGVLVCAAIVVSVVLLTTSSSDGTVDALGNPSPTAAASPAKVKIETNEDRINFLTSFGWEVDAKPLEFMEVRIPDEFNETFEEYNQIQKDQGYDLAKYKGKRVIRYAYKVNNYPTGEDDVVANLLVYKNKVIGGDICSARLDGFMHGFVKPEGNQAELESESQTELQGESPAPNTQKGTTQAPKA